MRDNKDVVRYIQSRKNYINTAHEPMNPSCEVSIVVPSYNEEFQIEKLINSLNNQKEINFNQFELHILINNNINEDPKIINANERTYTKLIQLRRDLKFKLFVSDFFSENTAFSVQEHSVGLIRDIGYAESVYRFAQNDKNGIIVSTDADTEVSQYFISEILKLFNARSEVIGYRGLIYYDRSKELQGENMYWDYHELDAYFSSLIKNYLKVFVGDFIYKPPSKFKFAGANSGARCLEVSKVNGVPHLKGREDVHFGYNLSRIGVVIEENNIVTYPSTRTEIRVAAGTGTGSKSSKNISEALENKSLMVYSLESYIKSRLVELKWEKILGTSITYKELCSVFTVDNNLIFDTNTLKYLYNTNSKLKSWEEISNDDKLRGIQLSIIERIGKKETVAKVLEDLNTEYANKYNDFERLFATKYEQQLLEHSKKNSEKIRYVVEIANKMGTCDGDIRSNITNVILNKKLDIDMDYLAKDRFLHSRDISFLIHALEGAKDLRKSLEELYFPHSEPFLTITNQKSICLAFIETQKGLLNYDSKHLELIP